MGREKVLDNIQSIKDEEIISHLNRIIKDNVYVLTSYNIMKYISTNEIFNLYLKTPLIKQILKLGKKGIFNLQQEFYEKIINQK